MIIVIGIFAAIAVQTVMLEVPGSEVPPPDANKSTLVPHDVFVIP